MNEKYEIVQDLIWNCFVADVIYKNNFVILKIVKCDTGEFLCSVIRDKSKFDIGRYNEAKKRGASTIIHRVAVKLKVAMYHVLTWDDVERGQTTKEHVGEVQRNLDGTPFVYAPGSIIVLFENFAGHDGKLVGNQMCQDYAEVGSSYAAEKLKYSNRESYLRSKKTDEMSLQEDNDDCRSNFYDSWIENAERRSYEEYDMSEEDIIMSALENGQGEVLGY